MVFCIILFFVEKFILHYDADITSYYWYVPFQLLWYLIFFAIVKIPGAYEFKYAIMGIVAILIFFAGTSLQIEQSISFMLGVAISDNKDTLCKWVKNNKILGLFLGFGMGLWIFWLLWVLNKIPVLIGLENTFIWYLMMLIMKDCLALFTVGFTYRISCAVNNKFFKYLGNMTLEIYLVHVRLLPLLSVSLPLWIRMVLFLGISMFLAWLLSMLIRKLLAVESKKISSK